jgi:hypothetical protein
MPVITPAFPSMCSTHNITLSTKQIILRELQRGGDLVDLIFAKRLNWKDLFEGHTFFTQDYKYYLSVIATGRTREAAMSWSGLVGSRVRTLIGDLDNDELIKVACPFNKGFERVHHCKNDDEVEAVMRGDLRYQANDVKTETTDPANEPKNAALAEGAVEGSATEDVKKSDGSEATVLYTTTHYIGLKLEEREETYGFHSLLADDLQTRKSLTSLGPRTVSERGASLLLRITTVQPTCMLCILESKSPLCAVNRRLSYTLVSTYQTTCSSRERSSRPRLRRRCPRRMARSSEQIQMVPKTIRSPSRKGNLLRMRT